MKKLLAIALAWLSLCCAVNAQVPSQGWMVPSNPPGVQANLNSGSDPTVNNDSTQGYQVGSIWQNSSAGRIWIARSVAAGAAIWNQLELADFPTYIANNWYVGKGPARMSSGGGTAPGTGSIRLYPAYIKTRITISNLGLRISTAAAAGNVQAAIYANNPVTGRPTGSALVSTASMSTTSVGNVSAAAGVQLEAGLYWFATNSDNATVAFSSIDIADLFMEITIGANAQNIGLNTSGAIMGLAVTQSFGTWPSLSAASFTETTTQTFPLVQFQVSSVP